MQIFVTFDDNNRQLLSNNPQTARPQPDSKKYKNFKNHYLMIKL
jgi:hypothetical protein